MQRQQIFQQKHTIDSQINKAQSQQGSDSQIFYTIASDHDLILNQQQLQNFNKISQQTQNQKSNYPTNFRKTQLNKNLSIVNSFHSRRKSQIINYNPENKGEHVDVQRDGGFKGMSDSNRMGEKSSTALYRIKVTNSREELINQEVFQVKGNWRNNAGKQEGKVYEEIDKKIDNKVDQEIDYKVDDKINNKNNEKVQEVQEVQKIDNENDNDEDIYIISCPYQLKLFPDKGPNIITKDQIINNQQQATLEKSKEIVVAAIRKIIPIIDQKSQQRQRVREKSRLQLLQKRQIEEKKMQKEIETQKRLREDLKRFGVEIEDIDETESDQNCQNMNQQTKQFSSEPELTQKQSTKIPQIRTINKLQTLIGSCYYLSKLKLTNTSIQTRYSKFTSQNEFQKVKYQLTSHDLLINRSALSIPILSITKIKLMPVTLTKQQRNEIICKAKYLIQLKITFGCAEEINNKVIEREEIIFLIESYEVIFSIFSSIIVRKLLLADSVGEENQVCHTIRMILSQYNLAVTCFMDKSKFIQFCGAKRVNRDIEYKCPEFKGVVYRKGRMLKKWETNSYF